MAVGEEAEKHQLERLVAFRRPPSRPRRARGRKARGPERGPRRSPPASRRLRASSVGRDAARESVVWCVGRSGRTSDHVLSPTIARAAPAGARARSVFATRAARRRSSAGAARAGSGGRTTPRPRAPPRARCGQGSRAGAAAPAALAGRCGAARSGGNARRSARSARTSAVAADDERIDAESETPRVPGQNDATTTSASVGRTRNAQRTEDMPPHGPASAGRTDAGCSSTLVRRGRSSSRTCSRASIASSFIAASTSWCENLACVNSAVRRATASESGASSRSTRPRYSSAVSALPRDARSPRGRAPCERMPRRSRVVDPPRHGGRRARRRVRGQQLGEEPPTRRHDVARRRDTTYAQAADERDRRPTTTNQRDPWLVRWSGPAGPGRGPRRSPVAGALRPRSAPPVLSAREAPDVNDGEGHDDERDRRQPANTRR